jgi:alkyl hydroperoxide reductase subunit F
VTANLGGKSELTVELPDAGPHHVLRAREQVAVFRGQIEYLSHVLRRARVVSVEERRAGFTLEVRMHGSSDSEELAAEQLIVATGTTPRPLNAPGESEFFGKALGSSAISYSHLVRDRHAVVIGDSDRAIESAVECSMQADRVSLVMEPGAEYAPAHLEAAGRNHAVEIYRGYRVIRFLGDEFARRVELAGESDDAESPRTVVEADVFFEEREPIPNSSLVQHLVRRTPRGAINIDETNATSNPRIFAAGDVTTVGVEQIVVALGEGARAALGAYRRLYLR